MARAMPPLGRLEARLRRERDAREYLIRNAREVTALCGQAIVSMHTGDEALARRRLERAGALLRRYRRRAPGGLARHLAVPEQEFAEASALEAVRKGRRIPSPAGLGVAPGPYVLGLLDCVGELKRLALDRIRTGETAEASRVFGVMEEVYLRLLPLAEYDKVVREARRKLDVARILVDDARAAVTEEVRRAGLIAALKGGAGDGI